MLVLCDLTLIELFIGLIILIPLVVYLFVMLILERLSRMDRNFIQELKHVFNRRRVRIK